MAFLPWFTFSVLVTLTSAWLNIYYTDYISHTFHVSRVILRIIDIFIEFISIISTFLSVTYICRLVHRSLFDFSWNSPLALSTSGRSLFQMWNRQTWTVICAISCTSRFFTLPFQTMNLRNTLHKHCALALSFIGHMICRYVKCAPMQTN